MTTTADDTPARKGGRPSAGADRLIMQPIRMKATDWEYVQLWRPTASLQDAMRDLVERARKMSPAGPDAFGHKTTKQPKKRLPTAKLRAYAEERGIREEDAAAIALNEFFEMQKRQG